MKKIIFILLVLALLTGCLEDPQPYRTVEARIVRVYTAEDRARDAKLTKTIITYPHVTFENIETGEIFIEGTNVYYGEIGDIVKVRTDYKPEGVKDE